MNPTLVAVLAVLLLPSTTAAWGAPMSAPRPSLRITPTTASSPSTTPPGTAVLRRPLARPEPLLALLPAAAYASLGGVTLGAVHLLQPVFPHALALVGGSVALPASLLATRLLTMGSAGVAEAMGGVPADAHVATLAKDAARAVGAPEPARVYTIDRDEPNAFAAGLRSKDSTVAVTTGLVKALNDDELRAVLAHEMGHILHNDVARNMHVAIAAVGLGGVYEAGRMLLRSSPRKRKKDKEEDGAASAGLMLMGLGLGSQGIAHLLRLGASRSAELRADRVAAEAFGADALISALRKIDRRAASHSDLRSSTAGRAMAFSMISDGPSAPRQAQRGSWLGWISKLGGWLRTHPGLDERILSLEGLANRGDVPRRRPRTSPWTHLLG